MISFQNLISKKENIFSSLSTWGIVFFTFTFFGCKHSFSQSTWVGTWSTAQQLVEPHNMPPEPGLTYNTFRQVLRVSIGGDSLRVIFSNEFSSSPVTFKEVQIAASLGNSTVDQSTVKELYFNNENKITMQPGVVIASDPVAFDLKPRMDVAITIYFGETSPDVTGHPGSRTTSYLMEGNHVSETVFENPVTTEHWYVINGIDVKTTEKAAAIAILGNSITDGRGSGTNKQNRWPDIFSERLLENQATQNVAVLNQGIGGNCVLRQCLGPAAKERFERDILKQHGVRWLIVYEGINDLGQTPDSIIANRIANDLIAAYEEMIDKAHAEGIIVYGATLMPFGKSFYYAGFREAARSKVNEWIRTSSRFDAVIDFEKAMQNPDDPSCMIEDAHMGDYLHPNENGHRILGETVDLGLFEMEEN